MATPKGGGGPQSHERQCGHPAAVAQSSALAVNMAPRFRAELCRPVADMPAGLATMGEQPVAGTEAEGRLGLMNPNFMAALAELGGGSDALKSVLSKIRFGVFVDHGERGCIYANAEVLRMFEMDWESFRGFGWARVVVPEDMEMMREAIERYEIEKTQIEVQYRINLPDGSRRVIHVVGQAALDDNGDQLGSVMIGRDITHERAVSEQANRLQKLEAVGRLASRVAHDFNNVLTPIMFSTAQLEQEALSDDGRASLDIINSGAQHAAAITRQLLSLSQQQVGDPNLTAVDVELGSKAPLIRQLLGERITMDLRLGAPEAEAMLAPHELAQIILNLASNGRDAIEGNGQVSIETKRRDAFVDVVVTDNGSGMSEGTQRQVFEPFFTTKTPDRGTGLGLFTVRELVQRAGGSIALRTALGEGTTFTLSFPCVVRSAEVAADARAAADLPPQRVLLVDDNTALRQALAYALALQGHAVKTSADVGRAQELLREEIFDIIVTDILLPDGNGVELVKDARQVQPEIRVIYISGFAGGVHNELGLDCPHTVFLAKPFHPSRLTAAMSEVTHARSDKAVG